MSKNFDSKNISLIHGDKIISSNLAGGDFVMAEATNTRLMGVVGIHMVRARDSEEYHQLFYLDMEEYGFDDYQSFLLPKGESLQDLKTAIAQLFGGLGGKHIPITEREAVYLICSASTLNKKNKLELPEGEDEYRAILDSPVSLSQEEKTTLLYKLSEEFTSDYALINYYIMRQVGKDETAVQFLSIPEGSYDRIELSEPGTLYRNEIDEDDNTLSQTLSRTYHSTSFIEDEDEYRLIRSEIQVSSTKVISFKIISDMVVSPWEAANIIRRNEYLIHRLVEKGGDEVLDKLRVLYPEATYNLHPGGILMMFFREDNSHVANRVYRLDSDVIVSIYFRFKGDILIAGTNPILVSDWNDRIINLLRLENMDVGIGSRYAFPEPVLGKFISGDGDLYDGFLEFLQIFTVQKPT